MGVRNGKRGQANRSPRRRNSSSDGAAKPGAAAWPVIDLFSGCGGMSYGFASRPPFRLIAAVDAERAKPCEGFGRLKCNETYRANIGVAPFDRDIGAMDPEAFLHEISDLTTPRLRRGSLTALLCCPPCTNFSRAKPANHLSDQPGNALVAKCADFVEALLPEFVVMENARELITGNHPHHYREFVSRLEALGYAVRGGVHLLTKYGLPQIRERALVIASRASSVRTLDDLWHGWEVAPEATTVRHAISAMSRPRLAAGVASPGDSMHQAPGFATELVRRRVDAIPADGGSWTDLVDHPQADELLIDSMKERLARNDTGSHPDVYGRLSWDRPCVTIKRECAHVGNGRYAHPEQTRLLTVREMASLQGFPHKYEFRSSSLANRYRHIGDAVPPLISYQLSALVQWMKSGKRPTPADWVLAGCSLRTSDITDKR
jgi:DNA (cytosine-5)-methyltransferase 1